MQKTLQIIGGALGLDPFKAYVPVNGGHLTFEVEARTVPEEIQTFLLARGWCASGEGQYSCSGYIALRWDEAMAIEFYRFITLGGGNAQNQKG